MPLPRTGAPGRKTDKIGADRHVLIGLSVPQSERALEYIDVEIARPVGRGARVGGNDVEAVHLDVAASQFVDCEDLDTARGGNGAQFGLAKARDRGIVEDRALVRGSVETDVANPVVARQLKAIGPRGESDAGLCAGTGQRLARGKPDRRRVGEPALHRDLANIAVVCRGDQGIDRFHRSFRSTHAPIFRWGRARSIAAP
jgi:hypothetical protein